MISGEKILITGVSGMVGEPLARHLAKDNEVWGVARFTDPDVRRALSDAGIVTRAINVGDGDFSDLPSDFTYVLQLNFMRGGLADLNEAIRVNVEGPGLLMQHCRRAKATLVMSSMPIYSPNPDPTHLFAETDPIGSTSYAYAPTSPYSKAGVEAVARTCARLFDMKVVIARLNTVAGPPTSMPAQVIRSVLADRPVTLPHAVNMQSPIHMDDMKWQLEALLDAASKPALIVNWGGDEAILTQDWVDKANEWSGKNTPAEVRTVPGAPIANAADPTLRRSITGPCRTDFWEGFRRQYDEILASGDLTAVAGQSGIEIDKQRASKPTPSNPSDASR
jgi:nucleoside-diphosphate-sugar epimerase